MRRWHIALASFLLVALVGVLVASPASSQKKKRVVDQAVISLSEPPSFSTAGARFRVEFSVGNEGTRGIGGKSIIRLYLDRDPSNTKGRIRAGFSRFLSPSGLGRKRTRRRFAKIPTTTANGEYFLVACVSKKGLVERGLRKRNNCRSSGQVVGVGLSNIGPQGPQGNATETRIDRFTLPIGSPTIDSTVETSPGDDEKSDQRREFAKVGPVSVVADCKRTTNGDGAPPGDAFTSANNFDEDGDEAKILVYTDSGTVTFNSMGASARPNVGPGEGAPDDESAATNVEKATSGGEGRHMAIAAARDPDQTTPEEDWVFGYKVGSIYISHSDGTELVFHGYAGIDVLGVGNNCVFGGTLKVVS